MRATGGRPGSKSAGGEGSAPRPGQRRIEADERRKRRGDVLSPDLFGMAIRRQHEVARLEMDREVLEARDSPLEITVVESER